MKDHELKVKCKKTGKELIVSKRFYADHAADYELLEGEALELKQAQGFIPPKPMEATLINKEEKLEAKNKEKPAKKAPAKKVEAPKL